MANRQRSTGGRSPWRRKPLPPSAVGDHGDSVAATTTSHVIDGDGIPGEGARARARPPASSTPPATTTTRPSPRDDGSGSEMCFPRPDNRDGGRHRNSLHHHDGGDDGDETGSSLPATKTTAVSQRDDREDHGHDHDHGHDGRGDNELKRHLGLFDLVSIGVGGTVGSGIFVLCGLIANEHAGPATCVSWIMSGAAAFLSGFCYAELSGRICSAGSSYAYAFVAMGELPAFVTASCLSLEFLVSGAAVARSWGDKVVEWLQVELGAGHWVSKYLDPGLGLNPMAFFVSAGSTLLFLGGVRESKIVTDVFTWAKVSLVVFMAVGGLVLLDPSNLRPFVPPEFGFPGVVRGATSSFFGYLGYDGICCVAGEAKNPSRNLPRAVMITLAVVSCLYVVAALALTGMQRYTEISPESAFPEAFASRGVHWAAQLTAFGEIVTLPVVVFISLILQPRLQYALARDELLPPIFCEVDSTGNLRKGGLIAGFIMTAIATFVPFNFLDDFISAGILIAFSITNSSLVILRRSSPEDRPFLLEKLLALFNGLAIVSCILLAHGLDTLAGNVLASFFCLLTASISFIISRKCPPSKCFGGVPTAPPSDAANERHFEAPLVPYLPCLGCFANWFLVAQLEAFGLALLLVYFTVVVGVYFLRRSGDGGAARNEENYEAVHHEEKDDDHLARECPSYNIELT